MTWRIFYADGTTYEGDAARAPRYGVLAILQGRVVEHGYDWYVLEDRWVGVKGDASLILKVLHRLSSIRVVLAGESVANEVFAPVLARAVAEQAAA